MTKHDLAITIAMGFGTMVAAKYLSGEVWPAVIVNVFLGIAYARLPRQVKP